MDFRDNPNYYYSDKPYKAKMICCDCRKVFKRKLAADLKIETDENWDTMICPNCGKKAEYVGPKFRAPKSDNTKAWKSIAVLNNIGTLRFMGFASNTVIIPESHKGLVDLVTNMKNRCEENISQWVRYEFNENNKTQIKAFSEIIKKIDKFLQSK